MFLIYLPTFSLPVAWVSFCRKLMVTCFCFLSSPLANSQPLSDFVTPKGLSRGPREELKGQEESYLNC